MHFWRRRVHTCKRVGWHDANPRWLDVLGDHSGFEPKLLQACEDDEAEQDDDKDDNGDHNDNR